MPERFTPVFRDRDELATATNLGSTLITALEQSACQIVICSPMAAKSRWVNEEILAFKRLGREHRIFCLIVAGEPGASAVPGQAELRVFPECADPQDGCRRRTDNGTQRADRGGRATAKDRKQTRCSS